MNYADVNKRLPPATPLIMATSEATGGTWVVKIWPYIEEKTLYDQFDKTKPSNDIANKKAVGTSLPWLICPSDSEKLSPDGVDPPGQHNDGGSGVFNPKNFPVMSLLVSGFPGTDARWTTARFARQFRQGSLIIAAKAMPSEAVRHCQRPNHPTGSISLFRRLVRAVSQRNQARRYYRRHDPRVHGRRDDSVPLSLYFTTAPISPLQEPIFRSTRLSVFRPPAKWPWVPASASRTIRATLKLAAIHRLAATRVIIRAVLICSWPMRARNLLSESIDFELFYLLRAPRAAKSRSCRS